MSHNGPRPKRAWDGTQKNSIQDVQQDLQTAVNSAFNPHLNSYKKTVAVLIRFEDDDIKGGPFEKELADVFTNLYKFHVELCLIKENEDPKTAVNQVLFKLRIAGYMDEGCLVIIVFSGHGERTERKPGQYELAVGGALDKSGNFRTKKLFWGFVGGLLEYYDADVLHILDCCYFTEGYDGSAEVLAENSTAGESSSSLSTCFTSALIKELRRISSHATTVAELHGRLMRGQSMHNLESRPFYAPRIRKQSITLRRMGGRSTTQLPAIAPDDPRMLITAHVDQNISPNDVNNLKKWLLTLVPNHVKGLEVRLEGLWKTTSSTLLLSLPVEIWTQLRDDPAYNYVGTVNSSNLLFEEASAVQSPASLALRPAPGPENTKPGFGSGFK